MAEINLTVNTFEDQNDGSDFDGLSVRDAILQANADPDNEYIINVPAGTYNLTIKNVVLPTTDSSVDTDTLFQSRLSTGDLDITGNVRLVGEDPDNTIIDAKLLTDPVVDPDNPFPEAPTTSIGDRIFDVLAANETVGRTNNGVLIVENITIQNGIISPENIDVATTNGGALNIELGAEATFLNSVIADSQTTAGQGGAINNDGILTLDKTVVRDNNSSDNAGGLYNTGTLNIYNSLFTGNLADAAAPDIIEGGGGAILNENGGTLVMVNTTISGNKSASGTDNTGPGDGGGGILSRGITRIINSTIVENFAQVGSGIYSETTTANTILVNTIVADNTGSPDLDGFFDPRSTNNLISNGNGSILDDRDDPEGKGNIVGGDTTPIIDPLIGPLQDNGGPTFTHALLSGSLALDAGDNSMVDFTLFFPDSPATDQRGSERISNGIIDLGAYELFVNGTTNNNTSDTNNTTTNTDTSSNAVSSRETTFPINNTNTNTDTGSNVVGSNNNQTNDEPTNNETGSNAVGSNSDTSTNDTTTNTDTGSDVVGSNNQTNDNPTNIETGNSQMGFNNSNSGNGNSNEGQNITDISDVSNDNSTGNHDSLFNTPINRFRNTEILGTYLYTGLQESQVIEESFDNFVNEGGAFNVSSASDDDLIAMYRFRNTILGTYLYAGETELSNIEANNPEFFNEGIAFYVYEGSADQGIDIYRFSNIDVPGTHIYVGAEEKANIEENNSNFVLDGLAFGVENFSVI